MVATPFINKNSFAKAIRLVKFTSNNKIKPYILGNGINFIICHKKPKILIIILNM